MIPAAVVQQIVDTARIEEVVGDYVNLKRRGSNLVGLCPFHNERTPSFSVSPSKGIYKCFGCGRAGNVVNFLMEHDSLTYPEALRNLAARYNIQIEETKKDEAAILSDQLAESLFVINNYVLNYYQAELFGTDEGRSLGLSYFKERGLTEDTIKKFGLGYAANEYEKFYGVATNAGYQPDLLVKSALVLQNERGKRYDFLRGRIVFPLYNLSGKVVGFAGRLMTNEKTAAKYINSSETEIYHKSKILYGLHQARNGIRKRDECLLVEGYMDVITMHQAGFDYAVASAGTSLTADQVRLVKRFTQNITFLYDGDDAGLKAALRGLDIALQENMNVRVCVIPDGDDPDSYLRKHGAAAMNDLLDEHGTHKQSFLHFQADQLLKQAGSDPVKRADVVSKIVESLALVNDPIRRNALVKSLAERMRVPEEILVRQINQHKRKALQKDLNVPASDALQLQQATAPDTASPNQDSGSRNLRVDLENAIAKTLIQFGDKPYDENETVAAFVINEIQTLEWCDKTAESVYKAFAQGLEQDALPAQNDLMQRNDEAVKKLVSDASMDSYTLSPRWQTNYDVITPKPEDTYRRYIFDVLNQYKLLWLTKLTMENHDEAKKAAEGSEKFYECMITKHALDKERARVAKLRGTTYMDMYKNLG